MADLKICLFRFRIYLSWFWPMVKKKGGGCNLPPFVMHHLFLSRVELKRSALQTNYVFLVPWLWNIELQILWVLLYSFPDSEQWCIFWIVSFMTDTLRLHSNDSKYCEFLKLLHIFCILECFNQNSSGFS